MADRLSVALSFAENEDERVEDAIDELLEGVWRLLMVSGFTKFKEKFQGFEDQYVVIGGTACNLLMENEDMSFRAQKMWILF